MVARVDPAGTTHYIYGDPDSPYRVSAARGPNGDADDGPLDRYLYGPRGNLYAILRGTTRFHVAVDQVGSPRIVTAADGSVVKRLEYDAYGVTTDLDPAFFLALGYAGGLRDPVTGLVRFGLRDYEPGSGRFTARDPAMFSGSPRSLYAYANNSPVTYSDPGGTASVSFGGYYGPGGGATIYFDPRAFLDLDRPLITGMCLEFGVGLGGGAEADFLEDAPTEAGLSAFAELGATMPGAGGKLGGDFDLICGNGKFKAGGNIAGAQGGFDSSGTPSAGAGSLPMGYKVEGKMGLKGCLPPPPG
jgi:RHS repeat-associated protein